MGNTLTRYAPFLVAGGLLAGCNGSAPDDLLGGEQTTQALVFVKAVAEESLNRTRSESNLYILSPISPDGEVRPLTAFARWRSSRARTTNPRPGSASARRASPPARPRAPPTPRPKPRGTPDPTPRSRTPPPSRSWVEGWKFPPIPAGTVRFTLPLLFTPPQGVTP